MQDSIPLREISLVGLIALGLFVALAIGSYSPYDTSFTYPGNGVEVQTLVGHFGAMFADVVLTLFGWIAWVLPIMLAIIGWRLVKHREEEAVWLVTLIRTLGWSSMLLALCVLMHMHFSIFANLKKK